VVQIIENWAVITGTVCAVEPCDKGVQYRTVVLDVETVTDVRGFPNLLSDAAGKTVPVIVSGTALDRAGIHIGARVQTKARKTTPFEVLASTEGLTPTPEEP
jgi:hypothetical protein